MLSASVLIFNGVCLKNKIGIINLLLKLNLYVSSSRYSRFKNSKNVMFSSILKSFKNSKKKITCCYTFFWLKGKFSFNSNGSNIVFSFMEGNG
jgi:hypothetical protein